MDWKPNMNVNSQTEKYFLNDLYRCFPRNTIYIGNCIINLDIICTLFGHKTLSLMHAHGQTNSPSQGSNEN